MHVKLTRGAVAANRVRPSKSASRPAPLRNRAPSRAENSVGSVQRRLVTVLLPNRTALYAMAITLALFVVLFSARLSVRGEIYPGVHAANIPLSGLSGAEARERLTASATTFNDQRVSLTYGDEVWTPTLSELGISLDVDGAVFAAMGYGRDNHVMSSLLRPLGVGGARVDLPLAIHIDRTVYDAELLRFASEAGIAPRDAAIAIVDGTPTITAEQDGATFDGTAVESALFHQLRTVNVEANADRPIAELTLTTIAQPAAIRSADLTAIEESVGRALSAPMVFSGAGQKWTLAPDELAKLIAFRPATGETPVEMVLISTSLQKIVTRIAGEIDQNPVAASIEEGDRVVRLIEEEPGRIVQSDAFVEAIAKAFAAGEHQVTIPITETTPERTSADLLQELGVTDLLAVGTSDFSGSEPGRTQNVETSAALVDGVLVPPGGEFTFNHAIGEINVTPGFVPAGASENGIAGTAVGGGVCQVTTTIFRAALKAGMPITEWWPHAYRNIYYEQGGWAPGFDASIQQPDDDPFKGSDFVFQNPTDGWLLLRSSISNETELTIELYGAPTGYTVEIDDPIYENFLWAAGMTPQESIDPTLPAGTVKEIQPARDGVTMTVIRRVYAADGTEISVDSFVSHYEPQGATFAVSPDMAGSTHNGL